MVNAEPHWPALARCAERGGSNEIELRAKLEAGHSVVWALPSGCIVLDHATDGACVGWLGVGTSKEFIAAEGEIAAFAKAHGCDRLRVEGRKGWKRRVPHWTVKHEDEETVTLELPI